MAVAWARRRRAVAPETGRRMDLIRQFIDLFLHLDQHLKQVIETYGTWTYLLLFVIVFCETGLVVTPILPGDSLLFAAGTFAGMGSLNLALVLVLLSVAAIVGDTVNYWIGKYLGPRLVRGNSRLIRKEHLDRTHAFFEKYGGKTIIIARFVPIVRTFAPFVAGLGAMTYGKFIAYNVIGGLMWVLICVMAGYWFGQRPVVQENFSLVVIAIVFISILPAIIEYIRHRMASRAAAQAREPLEP
jgi:membrane-associated protein